MATGRISLLVESPLRTTILAMQGLEPEVRKQIVAATKNAAQPIWAESTRARAQTRLQTRLADSARVGVTARNTFLRAGGVGTLSSGVSVAQLAPRIEFGERPDRPVKSTSRNGRQYQRRLGNAFGPRTREGKVAYPAAFQGAIRRIASLLTQTAVRTVHEEIEKVTRG